MQDCGRKPHRRSDLSNLKLFFSESNFFLIKNQSADLKNCSKRTPGFERCECLQNMDESNADRVKVNLKINTKLLGWYKKGKNNQSLAKNHFFPVNICHQYSLHALVNSIHEKLLFSPKLI